MPDCCKNFSYTFELQRVIRENKRKLARQKRQESHVNPIAQALEYQRIMQEEGFTQSQLAKKLEMSRVRVTQILNLLKLPEERQVYILQNGKKKITERNLRKTL